MAVNDKLNFLMILTNMTNNRLAQTVHFDVSYISRIRSGKRAVPRNRDFLETAAELFSEEIRSERARETASVLMNSGTEWPEDPKAGAGLILEWLNDDTYPFNERIESFLSEKKRDTEKNPDAAETGREMFPAGQPVQTFLGNRGKREGILKALDYLIATGETYEFFLYSDESLEWFMENREFLLQWRQRIITLIDRGCTMNLISSLNREYSEIREGIRMWLPILFSGKLRCSYRPRLRDSVYNRTLFVVKDCLAFTCNSLKITDYHAVNTLFFEKEAINAFMEEYNGYSGLCLPLFRQYLPDDSEAFCRQLSAFHEISVNTVCGGPSPSLYTVPDRLITSFEQQGCAASAVRTVREARKHFEELMNHGCRVTEILILPPRNDVLAGRIPLSFLNACGRPGLYYKPEEYAEHVRNAVRISRKYPNYHLLIGPEKFPGNLSFLGKEGTALFLCSGDPPNTCLYTAEQSLADSIAEICESFDSIGIERKLTELKLKNYFRSMEL